MRAFKGRALLADSSVLLIAPLLISRFFETLSLPFLGRFCIVKAVEVHICLDIFQLSGVIPAHFHSDLRVGDSHYKTRANTLASIQ